MLAFLPTAPPAAAQARTCLASPHGVVRRICRELVRAGRPERLRQLTFVAFELRAEARPQLWPADAFRITRHRASWGDVPRIEIVDAKLLFVERNGLTRPAEVSLALGPATAAPPGTCEQGVAFHFDGKLLDFEELGRDWTVSWSYPPDRVQPPVIDGATVRVTRFAPGPATLRIALRDRGRLVEELQVAVPECGPAPLP